MPKLGLLDCTFLLCVVAGYSTVAKVKDMPVRLGDRRPHAPRSRAEAASPSACRQILRRQACVLPENADAIIVVRMRLGSQRLT